MTTSFQQSDGMNYAPQGKPKPVCKPGEFIFAAAHLDHGHINGMCNGLTEAGGQLKWVYDPDSNKTAAFESKFPGVKVARSLDEILSDKEVQLVASAAVPCDRGPLGVKVMSAGKDYFTDKCPFTSPDQLEAARKKAKETGRKYMVYYSERLHSEAAIHAGRLVHEGRIGKVVQVLGLGPHRLGLTPRPDWFYLKAKYGGILTDIGSHQVEQFLYYTGAKDAKVLSASIANFDHPEHPELEDFGDAHLVGDNGACNYFRVDWFTPQGLSTWGDGRTFILGTKGYIELRKYVDVARHKKSGNVYMVTEKEEYFDVDGKIGYPYFGELILDCLNRTEKAMTQEHAFKAGELCMKAQAAAQRITSAAGRPEKQGLPADVKA
jgi:predicted dehydrogenase